MSKWIKPNSSILDVGAGTRALLKYLSYSCSYQSLDVVKVDDDTIVTDLNKERLNLNYNYNYNYIFCSGVIEYLINPKEFILDTSKFCKYIILSYHPYRIHTELLREKYGWLNALTLLELEDCLEIKYKIIDRKYLGEQILILGEVL